jgi:hypothetical protein
MVKLGSGDRKVMPFVILMALAKAVMQKMAQDANYTC